MKSNLQLLWIFSSLFSIGIFNLSAQSGETLTFKHFDVIEKDSTVVNIVPKKVTVLPLWAEGVNQNKWSWRGKPQNADTPYFEGPIPYMLPPLENSNEPFYSHNHQPSLTWLDNGDLMAIWFTTNKESGTEMTVLASRLRKGKDKWDPSSEFYKASNRNMTGSSLFNDGNGNLYHFNSLGFENRDGWADLSILLRISRDNGVSWTTPKAIAPKIKGRHQVIDGTIVTSEGYIIQPCDAHWSMSGGTALMISKDGGVSWEDPGEGQKIPSYVDGGVGNGTIAGIHGGVVELKNGDLMALGRSDNINGYMPLSISKDLGKTWRYSPSPFPPIGGGQRLVLTRLKEGPILLVSFTHHPQVEYGGMMFKNKEDTEFKGKGLYAALSYDEGKTWPVKKLITPGAGTFNGGGWTGDFTATLQQAEPRGYLSATQTPDNIIHLISSRLHYRFNLKWLESPSE